MAEASRLLKKGGTILLRLHGLGYSLRVIFGKRRRGLKEKLGAGLAILSTICNRLVVEFGIKVGHSDTSLCQ